MKISVVIPTHNRPDLLLEAVESIAAQTHLNWEIVIVDDGSSPAIPLDQLKSHLGGNAIFIRHDKPRGVACRAFGALWASELRQFSLPHLKLLARLMLPNKYL